MAMSDNLWVAVTSGSNRIILWDSVPDMSQLPGISSLSLSAIQSNACSPQCSGAGVCSTSGKCTCPPGFNGTSCELCAQGFFGPSCQACPAGCTTCDDGISGSGRCLSSTVANSTACNCLNGVCGANGQCTCNAGWTTASNGTQCATCAPGFFLDGNGDCSVCALGCQQCADGSGVCVTCKQGFTQDANDRTKCDAVQSVTSAGTVCPDGSFSNGSTCQPCSPSCSTCSGATSNDCIVCGNGQFTLGGSCVPTNGNGVCDGSSMVANNNKHECDSEHYYFYPRSDLIGNTGCPAKCTSCGIPNFNVASTINQLQCTACLPGFVLSNGSCIESCPSGTFLSPKDNLTCTGMFFFLYLRLLFLRTAITACSSQCGTCVGAADFCLTCNGGQLASGGKCVSSCPSNTITTAGTCTSCHPDCATCSGTSFNQCSSCPSNRPVLSNGRCLPTCSKTQFFDTTSGSCQSCDGSCSSCSSSGPSNCLACSSSSSVLRGGSCVPANCNGNGTTTTATTTVVPGLGVCLSELVSVQASGASVPLPTITGLNSPAVNGGRRLAWWEILLMTLGCVFIFVCVVALFRRRMRAKRAKRTAAFAEAKNIDARGVGWRQKLGSLFRSPFSRDRNIPKEDKVALRVARLRNLEEERHMAALGKLGGQPSSQYARSVTEAADTESMYSQVTGRPPRAPVPRKPVNLRGIVERGPSSTRFSGTTVSSVKSDREISEAQRYAKSVDEEEPDELDPVSGGDKYWLVPAGTGTDQVSRNPFLRK